MDKATDEILAKVKKLMALGESPSEAEAASALEKARMLLARYGLSISDVEAKETEVVEGVLLEKRRLRAWESHLVWVVTRATFTQALHVTRGDTSQVLIIGREVNTAAAAELFKYLHLTVLKLGRAHGKEVYHLDSFKVGVVERIGERLTESADGEAWCGDADDDVAPGKKRSAKGAREPSTTDGAGTTAADRALMVQMTVASERENDAYIKSKYGETKAKRGGRRVDADSYHRGRAAGEGVNLNRQIGARQARR